MWLASLRRNSRPEQVREASVPNLVVVYGAPLSGKSSLAREIARSFDEKTAIVSTDSMLQDAIQVHDRDPYAELEVVHTQARLLVANYLKNRYHVILEGAFSYVRDGALHAHEQEIDQILGLMRNLAAAPLIVRLSATPETLRLRAAESPRLHDVEAALRIDASYRQRYGTGTLLLSTDDAEVSGLAAEVVGRLTSR